MKSTNPVIWIVLVLLLLNMLSMNARLELSRDRLKAQQEQLDRHSKLHEGCGGLWKTHLEKNH